jgi:hypothetical protein
MRGIIIIPAIRMVLVLVLVFLEWKPSESDFIVLVDDIGTSEVNCSHNGIGVVETEPTDGNSNVGDSVNDYSPQLIAQ